MELSYTEPSGELITMSVECGLENSKNQLFLIVRNPKNQWAGKDNVYYECYGYCMTVKGHTVFNVRQQNQSEYKRIIKAKRIKIFTLHSGTTFDLWQDCAKVSDEKLNLFLDNMKNEHIITGHKTDNGMIIQ